MEHCACWMTGMNNNEYSQLMHLYAFIFYCFLLLSTWVKCFNPVLAYSYGINRRHCFSVSWLRLDDQHIFRILITMNLTRPNIGNSFAIACHPNITYQPSDWYATLKDSAIADLRIFPHNHFRSFQAVGNQVFNRHISTFRMSAFHVMKSSNISALTRQVMAKLPYAYDKMAQRPHAGSRRCWPWAKLPWTLKRNEKATGDTWFIRNMWGIMEHCLKLHKATNQMWSYKQVSNEFVDVWADPPDPRILCDSTRWPGGDMSKLRQRLMIVWIQVDTYV